MSIAVYRQELSDGVADRIRSQCSVAAIAQVSPGRRSAIPQSALAELSRPTQATAAQDDFDLHPIDSILATTGWNGNDDVFEPLEVWAARRTPEQKQLNVGHDDSKIVGHIVTSAAVDSDLKPLADDLAADELPAKFHVLTGGVLYTSWRTPELQERMDELLASIARGGLFVSMECLFKGFDYSLKGADGTTRVVVRNEKTAFLTKHLRAYGGTGKYGTERVGRVLRALVFSGKGLVTNPANPDSIILPPATTEAAVASWFADGCQFATAAEVKPATGLAQDIANYLAG